MSARTNGHTLSTGSISFCTPDTIACLKITLDDVEPVVIRRVEAPFDIRLDRLHLTIQAAMGWTNSHLYEIRARDVVGWSTLDRLRRGAVGGAVERLYQSAQRS